MFLATQYLESTVNKFKFIIFLIPFVFFGGVLTACSADTKVKAAVGNNANKEVVKDKGAAPITQPGGYSNIDNTTLNELVNQGFLLVDIRRKEEWQQTGVIAGSKTITLFDKRGNINPNFVPEFTKISDPEQPVILICHSGGRTQTASRAIAQQLGYKNVMNVTHGITGWIAQGRPVSSYN